MCSHDIYSKNDSYHPDKHPRKSRYTGPRIKDYETFKYKLEWIHGVGRFDLSNSHFISINHEISIVCNLCQNTLTVVPKSFFSNRSNCSGCVGGVRKENDERIAALSSKFPNLDFSKSEYVGSRLKMSVICRKHGEFMITPSRLFDQNCQVGCWECGIEKRSASKKLNFQTIIQRAIEVHGDKYDYSRLELEEYESIYQKGTIICPIHGSFKQSLNCHIQGKGCYHCQTFGWKDEAFFRKYPEQRNIPATLYILKMEDPSGGSFLKIGVSKKFDKRFRKFELDGLNPSVVYQATEHYQRCFLVEQEALDKFHDHRYTPSFMFGGWTECLREVVSFDLINYLNEKRAE